MLPYIAFDRDDPAPRTPFDPEGDGLYFIWSRNRGQWSYLFTPRPEYDIWNNATGFTMGYTSLLVFERCAFAAAPSWPVEKPRPALPWSIEEDPEDAFFVIRDRSDERPGALVLGRYASARKAKAAMRRIARELVVDCIMAKRIYNIFWH